MEQKEMPLSMETSKLILSFQEKLESLAIKEKYTLKQINLIKTFLINISELLKINYTWRKINESENK